MKFARQWLVEANRLWRRTAAVTVGAVCSISLLIPPATVAAVQGGVQDRRAKQFAAAAAEFNVPQALLLSVAYNQSRWENHGGQPSTSGGYGVMHLTAPTTHGGERYSGRGLDAPQRFAPVRGAANETVDREYTLAIAAEELMLPADVVRQEDAHNIRGGAAVLLRFVQEEHGGVVPSELGAWYPSVARFSGARQADGARQFADDVYALIQTGITHTTTDGQRLSIAPVTVQPERLLPSRLDFAPDGFRAAEAYQTECPRSITCKFVPARFAQNNPADPTDYGNYDIANRPQDIKVKYIVIHDTEGSYTSAIDWFQDPRSYVSAHYVIRSSDGEVTQMVPTKDVGWHAGNWYMNMHSIGVEHEGFEAEGAVWYTEAMYRSSAKLVRYLAERYDIPLDREHIIGHNQYHALRPDRTLGMHTDPGPFWDWEYYMELLQAPVTAEYSARGQVVTVAPRFAQNKPPVTACDEAGVCTSLPTQSTNFVYLRSEPRHDAPLLKDPGLHPDGAPGTTEHSDVSARAGHGQRFALAGWHGDWTAVWFGGQKGWLYNPRSSRTAFTSSGRLITPRDGLAQIPVYGRPVPELSAYSNGVPPLQPLPLAYTIPAGQTYVAYDKKAINDYYHVLAIDRSTPGDGMIVVGNETYIPIAYNHRQAFVRASDVQVVHN